ncbi:MAG TPA: FAD-dependent oxidoreductase, partial [Rhodobacteraceae bacterium]|nr:FAD-dependent oxidoreductase [Paracoccaceae bacterium]
MPTGPQKADLFDIAIIGAGVVGCAMARRFTLDGARVVVLEKAAEVLDGASKANSAILHTGFDAPPGSVEQKCIADGYAEYLEIRESLGLPLLKTGAMVLAWDDEQLAQLPELVKKAHKNGVADVALLSRAEILAQEPHLAETVKGGFTVPGEYLIDPWAS